VEWIADAMRALRDRGTPVLEATEAAEQEWTAQLAAVAEATLFPRANSWYMGANVPGKPRSFLAYLGVGAYRQICDEIAAEGYRGFDVREATSPVPA
jgi:cyclohexanone monooxygenase